MLVNKVVLIIEDDPLISRDIAEGFFQKGFQVFIESIVEKGKRKLQVLQSSNSKLDLAIVADNSEKTSSAFIRTLHNKYPAIKTIFLTESTPENMPSTCMNKSEIKLLQELDADTLDYSSEDFKSYFKEAKSRRRTEEVRSRIEATLSNYTPMTPAELDTYNKNRVLAAKKLSTFLLDVYKNRDRRTRNQAWRLFLDKCKFYKFQMTMKSTMNTLKYFHKATNFKYKQEQL